LSIEMMKNSMSIDLSPKKEPVTAEPHGLRYRQTPDQGRFIWQLVGVLDT
jgi:hypothetical protein